MLVKLAYNQSSKQEFINSEPSRIKKLQNNDDNIDSFLIENVLAGSLIDVELPAGRSNDLDQIRVKSGQDIFDKFAALDCINAGRGIKRSFEVHTGQSIRIDVIRKSVYGCYYLINIDIKDPVPALQITARIDDNDPMKVHFDVSGGVPPWSVDFGDGKPPHDADQGGVAHTYDTDGTYNVSVTDSVGTVAFTIITIISPAPAPAPAPPPEPQPEPEPLVLLSATVANEPQKRVFKIVGGEAPYLFDAGDGNEPVEVLEAGTQEWVYSESGSFTASVLDNAGHEAAKKVIISLV